MSFVFNGVSSDTMKFNVTSRQVYNAPAYDLNAIEVPGRSGDLLNPQNRFKNKQISYTGFLKASDFEGSTWREKLSTGLIQLKGWLCSDAGQYHELTDDYDPGFTRYGYISGETAISDVQDRPFGVTLTVTFNCKPFMYKAGESIELPETKSASTENPYPFGSRPLYEITMAGTGTLVVNGREWTITDYTGTLYCDTEAMERYDASQLRNNIVSGDGWPVFEAGENSVSYTGDITKVMVTPRWRTL